MTGKSIFTGSINLVREELNVFRAFEHRVVDNPLEQFQTLATDADERLCMDAVLVPAGFDRTYARNAVLGNYVMNLLRYA